MTSAILMVMLANLRAPMVVEQAPSATLTAPDAGVLIVRGEKLDFDCAGGACEVRAEYRVEAAAPVEVELAFVLPSNVPVTAAVGAANAPVAVAPTAPYEKPEFTESRRHQPLPLFQATFRAKLEAGVTPIRVRYRQPLAASEVGHGYFSAGRMVQRLRYELWPLKGWQRSPDFKLDLAVTADLGEIDCQLPGGVTLRGQRRMTHRATLGPDFPERLVCKLD